MNKTNAHCEYSLSEAQWIVCPTDEDDIYVRSPHLCRRASSSHLGEAIRDVMENGIVFVRRVP